MSGLTDTTFSKRFILRSPDNYRRVFKSGAAVSCPYAKLLFVDSDVAHCRLGLAISKKQIRHAVNRNSAKRICREAFRHRKTQLPPLDIIAMVRASALELPPGEFRLHIDKLFDRIIAHSDPASLT